jgi:hypothetical protein
LLLDGNNDVDAFNNCAAFAAPLDDDAFAIGAVCAKSALLLRDRPLCAPRLVGGGDGALVGPDVVVVVVVDVVVDVVVVGVVVVVVVGVVVDVAVAVAVVAVEADIAVEECFDPLDGVRGGPLVPLIFVKCEFLFCVSISVVRFECVRCH